MSRRIVAESPVDQGSNESVSYTLTTTTWGSSPTGVAVYLYDASGTDLSSTKLSGSASVLGDVITTPLVTGLTAGQSYTLMIKFTVSGNILSAKCVINAEL